jgi:tagaturonate reductase
VDPLNELNMKLSKKILQTIPKRNLQLPSIEQLVLPERVLQFGTGVLLRGLPDYFIHQANKNGLFNGRVVVVKSTAVGQTDAFDAQDGLYTHCIEGIKDGKQVQDFIINSAISRVLAASTDWIQILQLAEQRAINIIISNVTEAGFVIDNADKIFADIPKNFPGKLLALLYKRYVHFNGALDAGYIILPTELVPDNGNKLFEMVKELAIINSLPLLFIDWLKEANDFCNTLVDRIVPGRPPSDRQLAIHEIVGYEDDLMIVSEPYALWAIESCRPYTKKTLSFANQAGILVTPSILKFRELKLRLLNGTHTFSCAIASMMGFVTVKDAMENDVFCAYIKKLMHQEIIPCVLSKDISSSEANDFANDVIDRFKNPYLAHRWESIMVDVAAKMKTRNIPLIKKSLTIHKKVPVLMAVGYAAFLVVTGMFTGGQLTSNTNFFVWDTDDVCHSLFEEKTLLLAAVIEKEGVEFLLAELVSLKQIVNE